MTDKEFITVRGGHPITRQMLDESQAIFQRLQSDPNDRNFDFAVIPLRNRPGMYILTLAKTAVEMGEAE